jgi:hypothetical protein
MNSLNCIFIKNILIEWYICPIPVFYCRFFINAFFLPISSMISGFSAFEISNCSLTVKIFSKPLRS